MRDKETEADYRYFPDPNLMPIVISDEWLEEIRESMPKGIDEKENVYRAAGISDKEIDMLIHNHNASELLDAAVEKGCDAKNTAALILTDCAGILRKDDIKEPYHLRWGIETSFRELKYYIGVIHFHSKDERFIKQEIFANLIAYNFCAAIAMTVKIRNYNSEKYYYKIDFSFAFHVIKDYLCDFSKSPPSEIDSTISKKIKPVRKDRKDERKMKPKGVTPFMYRVA